MRFVKPFLLSKKTVVFPALSVNARYAVVDEHARGADHPRDPARIRARAGIDDDVQPAGARSARSAARKVRTAGVCAGGSKQDETAYRHRQRDGEAETSLHGSPPFVLLRRSPTDAIVPRTDRVRNSLNEKPSPRKSV